MKNTRSCDIIEISREKEILYDTSDGKKPYSPKRSDALTYSCSTEMGRLGGAERAALLLQEIKNRLDLEA